MLKSKSYKSEEDDDNDDDDDALTNGHEDFVDVEGGLGGGFQEQQAVVVSIDLSLLKHIQV